MEIKQVNSKNLWDSFINFKNVDFYSFLNSREWLQLKENLGFKTFKLGIFDNNELIGVLPIIKTVAKRGTYLFCPHGPLIKTNYFETLEKIKPQLIDLAKKENASFIRFNPPVKATKENYENFKKLGFRNAPIHEHVEDTHLLDLTKSEEELFSNLKKKDRYLINRAKKEGVKVRIDNNPDHIEILIKMHHEHSKKVGYVPFSEKFIKNLYKVFKDNIKTISTSYNGITESILMTIKYNETVSYYIAASNIINKKFSPNYLAQRTAILQAKKDGAKIYNFWGVSPDNNVKHPLHGVSDFKRKWGGYDYFLVHAQDLVISPKYWLTWIVESLRRIKRGYHYVYPKN